MIFRGRLRKGGGAVVFVWDGKMRFREVGVKGVEVMGESGRKDRFFCDSDRILRGLRRAVRA